MIRIDTIILVGASNGLITPPYGLNPDIASVETGVPYFGLLRYLSMYLIAEIGAWNGGDPGAAPQRGNAMDVGRDDTIPTTLRLLVVLEEVARAGVPVTPTEINARLGLPKPTIHRLFASLCDEGFLQRDIDGRSYAPGRRLRNMATGVLSSLRIRAARLAVLRKLSTEIGETCNVALPEHDGMVYLERVETEWPLRIQLPIGTKVPLYATASGKMYLSTLPGPHLHRYAHAEVLRPYTGTTVRDAGALIEEIARVKQDGYALDREEFMDGMIALAVPVSDANGRLVATLSFHAPVQRFSVETALRHLGALQSASAQLSSLMADDG